MPTHLCDTVLHLGRWEIENQSGENPVTTCLLCAAGGNAERNPLGKHFENGHQKSQ